MIHSPLVGPLTLSPLAEEFRDRGLDVDADRVQADVVAYVDAVVPGEGPFYEASEEFIAFVDSLPTAGSLLPPWPTWWGGEAIARLLPDQELRQRIVADTPSAPRSLYDDPVPLPVGWMTRRGCCFLQLSPAYADDRARAEGYGWITVERNGQHLDVAARPQDVGPTLIDLFERARAQSHE